MNDFTTTTSEPVNEQPADGPVIYPATGVGPQPTSSWRLTIIAVVLAVILGALLGGWLFSQWQQQTAAPVIAAATTSTEEPATPQPVAQLTPRVVGPMDDSTTSARIAALEERLARISVVADSASGNAAKAESILVAFAARRSIERGLGLGSMEPQLRVRFGDTQPNAVQSILRAAARPVLQEDLIQRLDTLRPVLTTDASAGWMKRVANSISGLIIVRSIDEPSQLPTQQYERARRALVNGRIGLAITEVEAMPGAADTQVQGWLTDARRLNDARRALDLIEAAAIIEPGQNRGTDSAVSSAPTAGDATQTP